MTKSGPTSEVKKQSGQDQRVVGRRFHAPQWLVLLSPIILYLVTSWLFMSPPHFSDLTKAIFNNGGDPQQFVWFYNWWPYSLMHHLNPFITRYSWYPLGYNLAWATSIPTLSLLMSPITLLGSAVLSFNLTAILSPVFASTACFFLVYYITKKYTPSLLAGYIYGFSSYEMSELLGHPQIYVDFLIPLLVLLVLLRLKNRIRSVSFIILSGLLLALQFGIATELFSTYVCFAIIGLIIFYIFVPSLRTRLLVISRELGLAVILFLVIASPYIYYLIRGYAHVPGVIHPISAFSINAANYFIPTPITLVGGHALSGLYKYFTANLSENGGYIGLPILLILLYITIKYWRQRVVRACVILLAVILVCALGPRLHIIGQAGSSIPMPWALVSWLPIIKYAQPDRFTVYGFMLIALLIGFWLSRETTPRNRSLKYVAAALGIVCILPNTAQYTWSSVSIPAVLQRTSITAHIPPQSNLLILPFERQGNSDYYQYASGMYFTQTGGYIGPLPKKYINNTVVSSLENGIIAPSFAHNFAYFCTLNRVNFIVYLPQTSPLIISAITSLHWPTEHFESASIVRVPTRSH